MAYTWKQFTDAVKVFLTVDKSRLGIAEDGGFTDQQIRQAVLEIESFIPFYRKGQQTKYQSTDFSPMGATSMFELPEGCEPRDMDVYRYKDPLSNLTGLTSANATTTIVGNGSKFTVEVSIGDLINVAGTPGYVAVTSIASDIQLTVQTPIGDGTVQAMKKLVQYRYPVLEAEWDKRQEFFAGQVAVNDKQAFVIFSPQGTAYIYPAIQALDIFGATDVLELNWDGVRLDFAPGDKTPFDEPMTQVVADYVKGQIALHVNHDVQEWAVFLRPPDSVGNMGTYYRGRRKLWLDAKRKSEVRD